MLVGAIYLAVCNGCSRSTAAQGDGGKPVLTVWHPWSGTRAPAFQRVLETYQREHPNIIVKALYTPNDLSNNQKFFTSVAAEKPPDVTFVDGPQVAEWAERGALQPLGKYLTLSGTKREDYFLPCWAQNSYRNQTWAMTCCADPNFAFVWNKKDFRDAGLDPLKPPRTLAELDSLAARLVKIDHGKIARIGVIPWEQYGHVNALFTWGWVFGGSFYDEANHRVTANHPKIVKALEWMVEYAHKFDVTKVDSLRQGFGVAEQDPFYIGQVSMKCLHLGGIDDIRRYSPGLDYGITFIPAPPNGELHSSWVGGWCMSLPAGSKHPAAGWEFIRWCTADKHGTDVVGREMGLMPGYRNSPAFRTLRSTPGFDQYYRILLGTKHQRPVMPVQAYYMGAIQRAVDAAIFGKKTARQALDDATAETQAELDVVLKGS
jgi:multiple sugar transport system substrate-binding protein